MPVAKITDRLVSETALPDGRTDLILWDTELTGFGLRVRPESKSWIVAYRPLGLGRSANMKRLKLASAQVVKHAAEARKMAREVLGRVANGVDPIEQRAVAKQRAKAQLADLIDRYDQDLARRSYVNRKTVVGGLRKKMSALLNRDVRDITGAELAQIIDQLEQDGRPGAAQDFRTHCRAFLNWCVVRAKILPVSPLAGFRRQRATRADRIARAIHGRALSDAELKIVWAAADPETSFGRFIRFLILTGCRRGEGAGLTRSMICRGGRRIELPASFVKQGRGHTVYVAPLLGALLESCPIDTRSDLLFPSPRTGGKMSGWTQLLRSFARECPVTFDLHDLRRTFRTGLSRLGIDLTIAELAVGHARSELETIYNRDKKDVLIGGAFQTWNDHIVKLTTSSIDIFE